MRVKVFGDLHLTNDAAIDAAVMKTVAGFIDADDALIFLGDVFDSFQIGMTNSVFYEMISKLDNEIYIIQGNHDFREGMAALNVARHFADNIHVIKDYETFDAHPFYKFHFLGYFRSRTAVEFDLGSKMNFLFSHCDAERADRIPESFKAFDQVYNGHIHDALDFMMDPAKRREFHNVGAMRQCRTNETDIKRYFVIDISESTNKVSITAPTFVSPTASIKMNFRDFDEAMDVGADAFDTSKPVVLTVEVESADERQQMIAEIAAMNAKDGVNIVLKTEMIGKRKSDMDVSIAQMEADTNLDFGTIFESFYADFQKEFKMTEDPAKMKSLFLENVGADGGAAMDMHSIKFLTISGENFKLFPQFEYDLRNFSGITSIVGENLDEPQADGTPSSNESGKSNLISAFLYALQGTASEISPLRWGEKSGVVVLRMSIDGDDIVMTRRFAAKTNGLEISVNGEAFAAEETTTATQEMFYARYKIESVLRFIFLTNSGFSKFFFSSKSSERYNLFAQIFPVITKVDDILAAVKATKEKNLAAVAEIDAAIATERESRKRFAQTHRSAIAASRKLCREYQNNLNLALAEESQIAADLAKYMDLVGDVSEYSGALRSLSGAIPTTLYDVYKSGVTLADVDRLMAVEDRLARCGSPALPVAEREEVERIKSTLAELEADVVDLGIKVGGDTESNLSADGQKLDKKLQESAVDLSRLKNRQAEIGKVLKSANEGNCSLCGQPLVSHDLVSAHEAELKVVMEDVTTTEVKLNKLGTENLILAQRIANLRALTTKTARIAELGIKKTNLEEKIAAAVEKVEEKKAIRAEHEALSEHPGIVKLVGLRNGIREYQALYAVLEDNSAPIARAGGLMAFTQSLAAIVQRYGDRNELRRKQSAVVGKIDAIDVGLKSQRQAVVTQTAGISPENAASHKRLQKFAGMRELSAAAARDYDILHKVLTGKKSMTFAKYFVSMFFEKLAGVFNSFLEFLFSRELRVALDGVDFKFSDSTSSEILFKDFSLGAKTKVETALLLTINMIFRRFGVESDLIALDEFLDTGLDSTNQERVFKLIQHFYEGRKVLVVSHKGAGAYADRIVTVRRESGASALVEA